MSELAATVLAKLEEIIPASLTKFDAFPKMPTAYKARSESRGFMTLLIGFITVLLMLNDIAEYVWGWPDFEFGVDDNKRSYFPINLDMTVAMPCKYLSVDLRDSMGDRLYLSNGFRRDGTFFNVGHATALKEHAEALSAQEAVKQSRRSRTIFSYFQKKKPLFKPTQDHQADGSSCRIWGTTNVKRVTANLHITTLGHGYASYEHVDHNSMNLTHVIDEFSFGPHFPDIVQPLDNSYELTHHHFMAYQYFLHVVPTTFIPPRSRPLDTHQYSVTHYTRTLDHNSGTPGIFFKFELDPLKITQIQRTTTLLQLFIRCVGVIGGVFVCASYALRTASRAVEVVTGENTKQGIVAAESTGVKVGLRAKWGGNDLRARPVVSAGWTPPSPYVGTPVTGTYSPVASPYMQGNGSTPSTPLGYGYPAAPPTPGGAGLRSASNLGPPSRTPSGSAAYPSSPYPGASFGPGTPSVAQAPGTPGFGPPTGSNEHLASPHLGHESVPSTPGYQYAAYPSSPRPGTNGNGLHAPPPPKKVITPKKDD